MIAHNDFTITPLGDAALIINFDNIIDEDINKKVLQLFQQLSIQKLNGVKDIVPAYSSLTIHYDAAAIKLNIINYRPAFEILQEDIKKTLTVYPETEIPYSQKIKIPVCYSEKYALDINDISKEKNLSIDEIIRLHTAKKYRVYMTGFLPGFAYMGIVDEKIIMPRKPQPRTNVAAGSVGIAGIQTGIYPLDSPGGWQIIGKTPVKLFDKEKDDPVLLQPGDEIEFYSITEDEFANY
ncbi:MAG TPA: 5-oxoprolinase subunit PxpB [Chitinophagaceae bacterium]|nr:5-oxoprolinase subunit PxpB [Chitinophagaceae bacterium]